MRKHRAPVQISSNPIVPGFESIIGQALPVRLLQHFLSRNAVPHALLFTGIEGIGKRTVAKIFAMALNCRSSSTNGSEQVIPQKDRPCGECPTCRQIETGRHPDVIHVTPIGGILRIDQIRTVRSALTMRPFSADRRVVIITDAHTLNAEAGNALLKVLEEPPDDTILILTALHPGDLLTTVVSRCRHVRFNPLPVSELARLIAETRGCDRTEAETIAEAAGGSCTKAATLAGAKYRETRDGIIAAAGLRGDTNRRTGASETLAFAAGLAQDKDQLPPRLEMLQTWIRDLRIFPHAPHHVINKDRTALLNVVTGTLTDGQLAGLWEAVEKARQDIAANGNLRLTLDVMALRMSRLLAA